MKESKLENPFKRDPRKKQDRESVGKMSLDLQNKYMDKEGEDYRDVRHEMTKDYEKKILEVVEDGIRVWDGDFYIVVLSKREKVMKNVLRNYMFHRNSCPTPNYDQIVYKYFKKDSRIDNVWVIPSKNKCAFMLDNMLEVPPEERDLLNFVIDFKEGELGKKCYELNDELKYVEKA
jgi:hypothetical protein